jgi:hypothetical protein
MRNYVLLTAALLIAPPLVAAQQTVVVPDVVVEVGPTPITIENTIEVMSDEERLDRIAAAVEGIAAILAECGCTQPSGPTYVERGVQGALVLAAFFIGFQLKGIKDNTADKSSDPVQDDPPSEDYPESK